MIRNPFEKKPTVVLHPSINPALERLGARQMTLDDFKEDGQWIRTASVPTDEPKAHNTKEPPAFEQPVPPSLSNRDLTTVERLMAALTEMEDQGYHYLSSYQTLQRILEQIKNGSLQDDALDQAVYSALPQAQAEMQTNQPIKESKHVSLSQHSIFKSLLSVFRKGGQNL